MAQVPGHGQQISISNVTMKYPSADAPSLNGVSLEIEPGEFITFLGPSGSGKTTLLSLIAGFVEPVSGHISIGGERIDGSKPHTRNLGVVFQNYLLFPHLTVFENVAFPLRQRKIPKAEITDRVDRVLSLVQLQAYSHRRPNELSGGQQQRVAFARAVAYDPRALLMDEPLGALDKNLRGEMQRELSRIHRELGMTFVFVTHDQEEALVLSDRIAVFNQGSIEQLGTPEELYYRPINLFVARFLGESNVLVGHVDREASTFVTGAGVAPMSPDVPVDDLVDVLIVRPEAITLAPEGELDEHAFQGTIREVSFTGSGSTVYFVFADGTPGVARVSAAKAALLTIGQSVSVVWDPNRQHLLRDRKTDG